MTGAIGNKPDIYTYSRGDHNTLLGPRQLTMIAGVGGRFLEGINRRADQVRTGMDGARDGWRPDGGERLRRAAVTAACGLPLALRPAARRPERLLLLPPQQGPAFLPAIIA